jgi:hypothetical protein
MANNPANVFVTGPNFQLYTATFGAVSAIPDQTVVYGGVWPTGWTSPGYSEAGVQINLGRTTQDIAVDQEIDPVVILTTARDIHMTTQLAEETGANLKAAQGYGTVTTVPASAGVRGMEDYDIPGGVPNVGYYLTAVEGQFQNGEAFRAVLWKTLPASTGAMTITKNGKATIPFTHRALPDATTSPTRVARLRKILAAL